MPIQKPQCTVPVTVKFQVEQIITPGDIVEGTSDLLDWVAQVIEEADDMALEHNLLQWLVSRVDLDCTDDVATAKAIHQRLGDMLASRGTPES